MQIKRMSKDAQASVQGNCLLVYGVAMQECFRDGDRPVALGWQSEGDFVPGTVYMIRTNIGIEGVLYPSQLYVRPVIDIFKLGIDVKRVEVAATTQEIVVFVGVLNRVRFDRMKPLFEVSCLQSLSAVFDAPPIQDGVKAPNAEVKFNLAPKEPPVVPFRDNGATAVADSGKQDPVDKKKVDDWINSAELKPEQIEILKPDRGPLPPVLNATEARAQGPVEATV